MIEGLNLHSRAGDDAGFVSGVRSHHDSAVNEWPEQESAGEIADRKSVLQEQAGGEVAALANLAIHAQVA